MGKNLFDEALEEYLDPKGFNEPCFEFVNKSTRPELKRIKSTISEWYNKYPSEDKSEIYSRIRSNNDNDFLGAVFELYCHYFLVEQGFTINVHKSSDENKLTAPDFQVSLNGKLTFYLEAIVCTDSLFDSAVEKIQRYIFDEINKLESPDFLVILKFVSTSENSPSPSKIIKFLKKKLEDIDYSSICDNLISNGIEVLPIWTFKRSGWEIEFTPIPKKPEKRGKRGRIIGNIPNKAVRLIHDSKRLRRSLGQKATKYGDFDCPYIIAINTLSPTLDNIDVITALFGIEQVEIDKEYQKPISDVPIEGLWLHSSGIQNKRVSAVLIVDDLSLSKIYKGYVNSTLWHNPWADKPLNKEVWNGEQVSYNIQTGDYN